MIYPDNRRCNSEGIPPAPWQKARPGTCRHSGYPRHREGLSRRLRALCLGAILAIAPLAQAEDRGVFAGQAGSAQAYASGQLTTEQLKLQCQPLMEGSQSLMSAFQSGQCSSYILGIYDLVVQQCPHLKISRGDAVLSTLAHLNTLPDNRAPAVQSIDHFLSSQSQCMPVASL